MGCFSSDTAPDASLCLAPAPAPAPQPHKQPPILSRDSNPGLVDLLWRSQVLKPSTAHAYASLSYIISSNPIVLARPLSILGVLAQQLPSTLKYINDNFDPNSYIYIHTHKYPLWKWAPKGHPYYGLACGNSRTCRCEVDSPLGSSI